MKHIILISTILLTGCQSDYERRYVCTDLITPWAESAYLGDGGSIIWFLKRNDYEYFVYKIPDGHVCRKERKINDHIRNQE